jgi:hypothetical protein
MSGPFMSEYGSAVAITTSDTVQQTYRGIYVGGAGNVTVETEGGSTTLFTAPPVGSIIPIRCVKVKATGTTATALVGLS